MREEGGGGGVLGVASTGWGSGDGDGGGCVEGKEVLLRGGGEGRFYNVLVGAGWQMRTVR
jgi:hypothetical protein